MSFLPKNFIDIRQHLSYGVGWSRLESQPIFKVKRSSEHTSIKTFAMEPVGPDGQTSPFSRLNEPQSG
ncbi:hypothetical protein H5410_056448 [Solanum commersonii]|uniref:Uncharacterized protein n=1 Tax=Solanum commersonii TaxID=4109 RepID=A0A9J5WLB7_SOLCO|nr:hypothetical protein H5410_056448 [Solanum commersonii]